jgi:lipoyl(octanoyl) transferase
MHGLALNVSPNLTHFDNIVPCGIQDRSVSSLSIELGQTPDLMSVSERLLTQVADRFGLTLTSASEPSLALEQWFNRLPATPE